MPFPSLQGWSAHLPLLQGVPSKLKELKIKASRSFQVKDLMEDDPISLREMALDVLGHCDHSLSSSQNISTHLGFPWPIKENFMDHARRYQEEHPYYVGLKFGIEENLRQWCEKEFVLFESCVSVSKTLWRQI